MTAGAPAAGCGKAEFPDKLSAELAIVRIQSQPGPFIKPTRSYQCPTCHRWHITSHSHTGRQRYV